MSTLGLLVEKGENFNNKKSKTVPKKAQHCNNNLFLKKMLEIGHVFTKGQLKF